jgi:flagellar biosynthesis protein FlhF
MKIKKFTAKSMKEALIQIRQEMGEDAVILKTAKVGGKLFSSGLIEVTAAIDEDANTMHQVFNPLNVNESYVQSKPGLVKPPPEYPLYTPLASSADISQTKDRRTPYTSAKIHAHDYSLMESKYEEIKSEIKELKRLFGIFIKNSNGNDIAGFSGSWAVLYKKLIDADVPENVSADIVSKVKISSEDKDDNIIKNFVKELNVCFSSSKKGVLNTKKPNLVMFVGPTGMGKTTTLAKLAAYNVLSKKRKVSVITSDTYRIAAIEQIRTFTEIMGIDLHVVFTPEEAIEAVERCSAFDVVFIDTAGRSPKSGEHLEELATLIEKIKPDDIHLVLSAGTKLLDLISIIEKYKSLNVNRLLFTKLDETIKLGNILASAWQTKMPFSYFTFGQRVPDDIELAQPQRLVQRLFEGNPL